MSAGRRATYAAVIAALLLVTLGFGARWVLHTSYFSVEDVRVTGNLHETRAQVVAASGLDGHPAMVDVDSATVARRLESLTWVARARVSLHWPHSVSIALTERVPVAVARGPGGRLELVDRTGRALAPVAHDTRYPLLVAEGAPAGSWPYSGWARGGAEVAARLPIAFSAQVDEVVVARSGDVSLVLTSPLTFRLGPPSDLRAKFLSVAAVIAHADLHAGDVVNVSVPGSPTVSGP